MVNVVGPLRTSYLIGLDELVARYAGADAARQVTLSAPWPAPSSNPYVPVTFETVARAFDSLVLNVDSLMALFDLNVQLGEPWDLPRLAGKHAAQARSRTLIEHRARLWSVGRMWAGGFRPELSITPKVVKFGGNAANYPSTGFLIHAVCRTVHTVRTLGRGLDPLEICVPLQPDAGREERLNRELPGIRLRFDATVYEFTYDRQAFFESRLQESRDAPVNYRDLVRAYYPPANVSFALRIVDVIERTVFEEMREPTLDQVAATSGVDVRAIQRAMRHGGLNLRTVIERLRVLRAENLLADTNDSVLEVAVAVGYTSQQALSKAFRRWRGLSPTEYRSRIEALRRQPQEATRSRSRRD